MTILLVDDEANVRIPLRNALRLSGYRVLEARDGAEGLELIDRHGSEISLVIVDLQMPRMSGIELVREVRRRPEYLPVIMMSGLGPLEAEVGTPGPDAFLRKPFEFVDLARTLKQLTSQA